MQQIFLLSLIFACATASAQVYQRIGPDGQVYFSDQPGPDAEEIEVRPAQTIHMPPVPERTDSAAHAGGKAADKTDEVSSPYSGFRFDSPTSEEGVRANDGNITVILSLEPGLMPGHSITLNIDGEDGRKTHAGVGTTIELMNLSRGRYTVDAAVVDAEGNELIQTGPVSFQVLRFAGG